MTYLLDLQELRASYIKMRDALPWLDASVWGEETPAFPEFAKPLCTPCAKATVAKADLADGLGTFEQDRPIHLLRYDPTTSGPLDALAPLLLAMAEAHVPLVVLHTDVDFPAISELAQAHPDLIIILESGPRKILYFIDQVEDLLKRRKNAYLSTYNFCNWLGLERLCQAGFGGKLLYGSHWPTYNPDLAMGPIAMGRLPWEVKCDIAGNNLRRVLGLDAEHLPAVEFAPPPPFIIDAHGHNVDAGVESPYDFPVPDLHMMPSDWTSFMDHIAVERIFTIPARTLWFPTETGRDGSRRLREHAPGRFRYLETFNPAGDEEHVRRFEQSLTDPDCVGIKIHPSQHDTEADSDAYRPAYELAERYSQPILTHSWEVSSYNPVQYMSHPDRFHKHLRRHPDVRFVLGHAGGRPSTFDAVVAVCRDYPNVMVDLAGDYFDNGLVEALAASIGAERILFASDVDWFDPRCTLAAVLGGDLPSQDVLLILRENALRFYRA